MYATLFIDNATTGAGVYRQACTNQATCTFTWASTSGSHTFSIETDDSTALAGGGTILSEGQQTYTLQAGANTLGTITLDGVPLRATMTAESLEPAGNSACQVQGLNCVSGTYGVTDQDDNLITAPGTFTEAILLAAGQGVSTMVAQSPNSPDSVGNDYSFEISCNTPTSSGTFVVVAGPAVSNNPYISAAQLQAYGLQVPGSFIATGFPTYQCTSGTISTVGPANGTVSVQSKTR